MAKLLFWRVMDALWALVQTLEVRYAFLLRSVDALDSSHAQAGSLAQELSTLIKGSKQVSAYRCHSVLACLVMLPPYRR